MKKITTGNGKHKETLFVVKNSHGAVYAVNHPRQTKDTALIAKVEVWGPRAVAGSIDAYWDTYRQMAMQAAGYGSFC